eukprot:676849_1
MGSTHSKSRSRSAVNTSNKNEKHDVVHEFSVLNAKQLTDFDIRVAQECGKQIEGIHKPWTIIVSYQSVQSMMILDEHILLCQRTTHQETKQWMSETIKKLKETIKKLKEEDNELLAQYQYDGVVFVMSCIAKVKEINGERTFQEYHDATGAMKQHA